MWKEDFIQFDYKSNLQEFLAEVMRKINTSDDRLVHKLEETFLSVMHQSYQVIGEDAFRFAASQNKRPINMALFETIAYFFAKYPANENSADTIKFHIEKLKIELDETQEFSKNADTAKGVEFRFQETIAILQDRLKL
jgi:hypothetical protein